VVFRLPAEAVPAYGGIDLGQQGYAVVQLVKATAPPAAEVAQREANYAQQLERVASQQDVVDYVDALKKRTKIVRHPERIGTRDGRAQP
jgi:peptidyl-prolyl cis-trans isomerase D